MPPKGGCSETAYAGCFHVLAVARTVLIDFRHSDVPRSRTSSSSYGEYTNFVLAPRFPPRMTITQHLLYRNAFPRRKATLRLKAEVDRSTLKRKHEIEAILRSHMRGAHDGIDDDDDSCIDDGGDSGMHVAAPDQLEEGDMDLIQYDERVKVICGTVVGMFDPAGLVVHMPDYDPEGMAMKDFEELGGLSASKAWKRSIRVYDSDAPGCRGQALGLWIDAHRA